jgi:hypothetical protein
MSGLRLGRIEDEKPVKVTVELSGQTFRALSEYARLHAEENGLSEALPPERLIGPMIVRFMSADRGFAKRRRSGGD